MNTEEKLTKFGEEVKAAVENKFLDDYNRGGIRRGVLCDNPECRWHNEPKGGHLTYSAKYRGFVCEDCQFVKPVLNSGKNLYDYSTTHLDGQKRYIGSLENMRRLEKEFGVSSVVANNDQAHWDIPPSVPEQRMNPELERFLGKAREMGQMDKGSRVSGEWQR